MSLVTLTRKRTFVAAAILVAIGAVLLFLMPNESTLGPVVKIVVLHGALVQAGLYAFLAAGILGVGWLATRRRAMLAWCTATQKTAVSVWIVYVLSSMLATRLAWGQWIAWDEPRVRSSAYVLGFALVALVLTRWVGDALFTALLNVVTAGVVWYLVKGVGVVRHPIDPLGPSTDGVFRAYALGLLAITVCLMLLLTSAWHGGAEKPGVTADGAHNPLD